MKCLIHVLKLGWENQSCSETEWWLLGSRTPLATKVSKAERKERIRGELSRGRWRIEKKSRKSNTEEPPSTSIDKWTTKPNNQTNISTARTFKRFKEIHITEHRTSLCEQINLQKKKIKKANQNTEQIVTQQRTTSKSRANRHEQTTNI